MQAGCRRPEIYDAGESPPCKRCVVIAVRRDTGPRKIPGSMVADVAVAKRMDPQRQGHDTLAARDGLLRIRRSTTIRTLALSSR
jgi:hypothetical protein